MTDFFIQIIYYFFNFMTDVFIQIIYYFFNFIFLMTDFFIRVFNFINFGADCYIIMNFISY